jgi:hypothetical protein
MATGSVALAAPKMDSHRVQDDTDTPRTPKERGGKFNGRFAKPDVVDAAADKVRTDAAGSCDSVTSAVDTGANSAAVVCNGREHAYFMRRSANGWAYAPPPQLAPKGTTSGQ